MKKLTGWAAIIAVPTSVTGWFGQNVAYAGSGQRWGLIASTVVITAPRSGPSCNAAVGAAGSRSGPIGQTPAAVTMPSVRKPATSPRSSP